MQSVQSHVYSTLHAWLFIRVNLCEKFSLSRIRNSEVSCDVTHPCVVYATLRPRIVTVSHGAATANSTGSRLRVQVGQRSR